MLISPTNLNENLLEFREHAKNISKFVEIQLENEVHRLLQGAPKNNLSGLAQRVAHSMPWYDKAKLRAEVKDLTSAPPMDDVRLQWGSGQRASPSRQCVLAQELRD